MHPLPIPESAQRLVGTRVVFEQYQDQFGLIRNRILSSDLEALHACAATVRVSFPGSVGTADMRLDRLNFRIAADGRVTDAYWG